MSERIRLGGMALANGVLVHSPRYWACAVRTRAGRLEVASGEKLVRAGEVSNDLLRGPARVVEVFALFPAVRRRLPEAKLPFQRPRVAVAMLGTALASRAIRESRLRPGVQEALVALMALAPAALALRGSSLAEYHGAEHISIGSYEHGEPRPREHERCGSHVVGPLLVTTAAGSTLARLAPPRVRPLARAGAVLGAVVGATRVFAWMQENERHPLARALARPGHELQHRFVTAEPSAEQLEVANAALAECLRLESGDDGGRGTEQEAPPT
jgi:uncharacterized protein YqhQ